MNTRVAGLALLVLTTACQGNPQPIEGHYRYGHEVNVVCNGDPQACYWLVDTSPDIRQQLKWQVADTPPIHQFA